MGNLSSKFCQAGLIKHGNLMRDGAQQLGESCQQGIKQGMEKFGIYLGLGIGLGLGLCVFASTCLYLWMKTRTLSKTISARGVRGEVPVQAAEEHPKHGITAEEQPKDGPTLAPRSALLIIQVIVHYRNDSMIFIPD